MNVILQITARNDDKEFVPIVFKDVELRSTTPEIRSFNVLGIFYPIVALGDVMYKFLARWKQEFTIVTSEQAEIVSQKISIMESNGQLTETMILPSQIGILIEKQSKV